MYYSVWLYVIMHLISEGMLVTVGLCRCAATSSSSFCWTPVTALPYWWLVARCPYPWLSSRQCKLQSSGAGRLHQPFWAKSSWSSPVSGWMERGGYDALVIFRWGWRWAKNVRQWDLPLQRLVYKSRTVVCLVYGIHRIFRRHQVSNTSRRLLGDGPCLTPIEQHW